MALRKFNAKKYQIAKLPRREEVCSKPIVKPAPVIAPVAEVPAVKKPKKAAAPKLRAKSTKDTK